MHRLLGPAQVRLRVLICLGSSLSPTVKTEMIQIILVSIETFAALGNILNSTWPVVHFIPLQRYNSRYTWNAGSVKCGIH